MPEVFIVSACRTAIGGFGGVTKDVPLQTLGAKAIAEAVRRAKVDPGDVAEVIMGCVIQAGNDVCPARVSALEAGFVGQVEFLAAGLQVFGRAGLQRFAGFHRDAEEFLQHLNPPDPLAF